MTQLALCIDDYALRPGVDAAVLDMADAGLATATSCLVGSPHWPGAAAALRRRATLDVGLHLDFTQSPLDRSLRSGLGSFILRAYLHALPADRIAREVRAQFDAFEDAMGRAPDHVDGHQHVHQLPLLRTLVLGELERRGHGGTWMRRTAAPAATAIKPRVIAALGGAALVRQAARQGQPLSGRLLGVYGFDAQQPAYAALLQGWLRQVRDGDVLMCHPGGADAEADLDPIAAARAIEWQVLRQQLPRLLQAADCQLVRLGAPAGAVGSSQG